MRANLTYWTSLLREAEQELDAAKTVAALKEAAKKLMEAKGELKRLNGDAHG
jgi:hypothetical protein